MCACRIVTTAGTVAKKNPRKFGFVRPFWHRFAATGRGHVL